MKTLVSILLLVALFLSSCNKNTGTNNNPGGDSLNVYLAGTDKSVDNSLPCFWKNDTRTNLPHTNGGDGKGIFVGGSNVYVSGRSWMDLAQTRYSPCYWLNGNRTNLPMLDDRGNGMANSIFVFNGVVYAAGTCSDSLEFFANSGWRNIPVYWKNGGIIKLEMLNGFGNASTTSIALVAAPNRVITYVVGTSYADNGYDEPCYWKIDPMTITTPGAEHEATALSSKGYGGSALNATQGNADLIYNDVYIAGFIDNEDGVNIPCYWHNGERTDLSKINSSDHGAATAIDLSGNDVYVAGYSNGTTGSRVPCIWKNGVRSDLNLPATAHAGEATSCKISGTDVYVAGIINTNNGEFPCYWKNGVIVQYPTMGTASSIGLSSK